MLEGAERHGRGGRQLRDRQGEVLRRPGSHGREDRAEEVPVDRVRERLRLPRGVEGHGRADQGRQPNGEGFGLGVIVPDEIDAYAEAHTTPPTELLAALAEETKANLRAPQMLTGAVEGRFLELLVYALGAKRVLELGTYSGYSLISMAAGLPEGGHIDTCEFDETHAEVARRYIAQSPYGDRITVHLGPALETIEKLEGEFDFVFVDADKENYVNYYEAVLPRLSERGFIAADNTLWSGRVLDESDQEEGTRAIRAFNEHVRSDERVTSVMLTVRDGITLIRPTGGS